MKIFSITPDRKNTTTGGGVSLGRLYLIRAIAFLSAKSASSVISSAFSAIPPLTGSVPDVLPAVSGYAPSPASCLHSPADARASVCADVKTEQTAAVATITCIFQPFPGTDLKDCGVRKKPGDPIKNPHSDASQSPYCIRHRPEASQGVFPCIFRHPPIPPSPNIVP